MDLCPGVPRRRGFLCMLSTSRKPEAGSSSVTYTETFDLDQCGQLLNTLVFECREEEGGADARHVPRDNGRDLYSGSGVRFGSNRAVVGMFEQQANPFVVASLMHAETQTHVTLTLATATVVVLMVFVVAFLIGFSYGRIRPHRV